MLLSWAQPVNLIIEILDLTSNLMKSKDCNKNIITLLRNDFLFEYYIQLPVDIEIKFETIQSTLFSLVLCPIRRGKKVSIYRRFFWICFPTWTSCARYCSANVWICQWRQSRVSIAFVTTLHPLIYDPIIISSTLSSLSTVTIGGQGTVKLIQCSTEFILWWTRLP